MSYNKSDIKKWLDARKQWGREVRTAPNGFRESPKAPATTLGEGTMALPARITDPARLLMAGKKKDDDSYLLNKIFEQMMVNSFKDLAWVDIPPMKSPDQYTWDNRYQQSPAGVMPNGSRVPSSKILETYIPWQNCEKSFNQSIRNWNAVHLLCQFVKQVVAAWAFYEVNDTMRRAAVLELREVPEVVTRKP